MQRVLLVATTAFIAFGCTEPRSGASWYETRCIDQYGMRPGTTEFNACISRERAYVEETQARGERIRP